MTTRPRRLRLEGVSHRYRSGPMVLEGIDLEVAAGERVAFVGPSGSGKTTLLSIIGLLTVPTTGSILLDGEPVPRAGRQRFQMRSRSFSWVFQTVNVLGRRTAIDNAALGLVARGVSRQSANQAAVKALMAVWLGDRSDERVANLSGGELQRVCIARAVAVPSTIVLADEPTGQLDHATSVRVLDAMRESLRTEATLIIATHDPTVVLLCSRIFEIVDGRLIEREP